MKGKTDICGFTLMELLVVLLLGMVLAGAVYSFFLPIFGAVRHVHEASFMQEGVRSALEIMIRDIRMADSFPNGKVGACSPVADAKSDQITVRMDVNGDGDCDDADEEISYQFVEDEKSIERKGSQADDFEDFIGGDDTGIQVDCFTFVYYDRNGNELAAPVADPDNVVFVEVRTVVRSSREVRGYTDDTVYDRIEDCGPFNDSFVRRYVEGFAAIRNKYIGEG
ncbi:prepilin-type N-terminal cleavage/methylation domain-containing protein [Thermodesulforhabdus norvegica]|uniref:Prepilin-type N-terminal cleavage/methylation domain-containing protein n=1 Tax=Thermodesulforhabdus norvegica TaxID=39841 RepID=A0A1I4TZR4_9BACT|nr:prepilin-type N-terminal cleavage/methylation domain-containing protein [Thermodesulforhabdus norvegica]SFM82252.1 hypothetical protein SAMN05660836_01617 [Thermodesulforhabdus norvegica]